MACNPLKSNTSIRGGEVKAESRHEPDNASSETKRTTTESRHEPDNASRETRKGNTASRHEPDTASRETQKEPPRQGTSPTPPQGRRKKGYTASRHEPDTASPRRDAIRHLQYVELTSRNGRWPATHKK